MKSNSLDMLRRLGMVKALHFYSLRFLNKYLGIRGSLNLIFCRQLTTSKPVNESQYQFRPVSEQDWSTYSSIEEYDCSPSFVRGALARGDICVGAFIDDQLVAYFWRAFSTTPHQGDIWVNVGPNAHYAYKSYTLPAFRGQHIISQVYACGDHLSLDRGLHYSVGFIDSTNYPSIKALKQKGVQFVGYAGYLYIFGTIIFYRTAGAKKQGFEFYNHTSRQ